MLTAVLVQYKGFDFHQIWQIIHRLQQNNDFTSAYDRPPHLLYNVFLSIYMTTLLELQSTVSITRIFFIDYLFLETKMRS